MQEEVENRTLTLVVSGTKFTGRLLKAAITKYLAHRKEKKLQKQKSRDAPVIPHGKQTVKQLIGQNQGVSNIRAGMKTAEERMKKLQKLIEYGKNYTEYKPVHDELKKLQNSLKNGYLKWVLHKNSKMTDSAKEMSINL